MSNDGNIHDHYPGILFTVGTYLVLSKGLLRIILGISLFSHAAHLMLMAINGLKKGPLRCSEKKRLLIQIQCRRL